MGDVYRAENPRLGTWLALKLLSQDLAGNEQFRERFVRESRAAASLDHPHVIPIFDADEAEGIPFIAMRYVEGSDLRTIMEQEGPLPVERTLEILGHIADALDWAHAKGLVHRDVKPANILLERRPKGKEHAYLSDFGVAKQALGRGLTSTGEFVGTIEYIAPEQIEGKTVDGRADVYALGCILYECLAGTPPYDRDSTVGLMYAHLQEPPPSLAEKRTELPPAVDPVIERALAKAPADRYATASELIAAARAAMRREAAAPAPTPAPVSRAETVVRSKPPAPAPVVPPPSPEPEPPAPIRGETVLSEPRQPEPARAATVLSERSAKEAREPVAKRSRRMLLVAAALLGAAALAAGGAYALFGGSDGSSKSTSGTPEPAPPSGAGPVVDPPPNPTPVRCRVANVKGQTLEAATRILVSRDCGVGLVTRAYSKSVPRNRISAQSPGAGIRLRRGGKVAILISRGPRPAPTPVAPEPVTSPPSGGGDPPPPSGDVCPANRCPDPGPKCPGGRCPGG